jgi:hypothetical protein
MFDCNQQNIYTKNALKKQHLKQELQNLYFLSIDEHQKTKMYKHNTKIKNELRNSIIKDFNVPDEIIDKLIEVTSETTASEYEHYENKLSDYILEQQNT